jgi:germination protein M
MAQRKRAANRAKASRGTSAPGTRKTSARDSRNTSTQGSRNTSTQGCLFWLVLAAVAIAVAVAAREPIKAAFARYLGSKTESAKERGGQPAPQTPSPAPAVTVHERPAAKETPKTTVSAPLTESLQEKPSVRPAPDAKPAMRRARLHFLSVKPDGTTALLPVDRELPQSDSPLRDAVLALLGGPDAREKERGLVSMIPGETRLRSATVKSRTAYLDFSESFRFTAGGVEGLTAELRQVVSTATEFPTVDRVQILIEGQKVQYLGTEGVRIDEPLSRASFAQ